MAWETFKLFNFDNNFKLFKINIYFQSFFEGYFGILIGIALLSLSKPVDKLSKFYFPSKNFANNINYFVKVNKCLLLNYLVSKT